MNQQEFDVCVIGSGFGGTMAALPFVDSGLRVLMVERGDWVARGPHNWAPDGTGDTTEYYNKESPYRVIEGGNEPLMGAYNCVGGPSNFYGGVSLRFREQDFVPPACIVQDSGAAWPFDYDELSAWYDRAEQLLDISGCAGQDPCEPRRGADYPQQAAPLSDISSAFVDSGEKLGLKPFRLPLAINYRESSRKCQMCPTCDTYACAVSAKNDLASTLIPDLQSRGMTLKTNTIARALHMEGKKVVAVECVDRHSGQPVKIRAKWFVLAAGALASPLIALNSGLQQFNPAGDAIGRYLMRHVNAIVFGLFPRLPGRLDTFHKQVGFHDFYFGASGTEPEHKLGAIQQIHSPPIALVKMHLPPIIGSLVAPLARRMTGLLAIGEDQPNAANHVRLSDVTDKFGMPQLQVYHSYSDRDKRVIKTLARQAKKILRATGAWIFYTHHIRTFSHAVGTMRMGNEPTTSPLDDLSRFRGVDNLSVTDGSAFSTSAAVNPSLTISALALRSSSKILAEGHLS